MDTTDGRFSIEEKMLLLLFFASGKRFPGKFIPVLCGLVWTLSGMKKEGRRKKGSKR